MTWNHRVVKFKTPHGDYLGICEAYYDEHGKVFAHDKEPSVRGDTLEELRQSLDWMLKSLDKPIVESIGDKPVDSEGTSYCHPGDDLPPDSFF